MRKFALLFLVAVLSFGFMGCTGIVRNPLNLPDPDQATVVGTFSDYEISNGQSVEFYVVWFEQRERFAHVRVDKATFDSVHEGDKVEVELISYTMTEDDVYFLETEYRWHVGDKKYQIIFKWDAKDRPVRPKPDPRKS